MASLWSKICKFLEGQLTGEEFSQWIEPIDAKPVDGGRLILRLPTRFHCEWFRKHYLPVISAYCEQNAIAGHIDLQVKIKAREIPRPETPSMEDAVVSREFRSCQDFATFVVAPFNQFAFTAARSLCEEGPFRHSPLFIEGASGLGKTHLLQAIGNFFTARRLGSAAYLDSQRLLRDDLSPDSLYWSHLRGALRDVEIFLIDDMHLLPNYGTIQQYLLELFDDFYNGERLLAFAATRLPQQLLNLASGLRSRLSWGLIARISNPDRSHRLHVIRALLTQAGLPVLPEVCNLLTEEPPIGFPSIQERVEKLKEIFQERGELPDINELVLSLGGKQTVTEPLSMKSIQQAMCKTYNVSLEALLGSCRARVLVLARQTGMYLARRILGATYASIGVSFGNRDHSTVMHACRKVVAEINRNPDFAARIVEIERILSIPCRE
jgi:chromosomal replication initiator protein